MVVRREVRNGKEHGSSCMILDYMSTAAGVHVSISLQPASLGLRAFDRQKRCGIV